MFNFKLIHKKLISLNLIVLILCLTTPVYVMAESDHKNSIRFEREVIDYNFGENDGIVSELKGEKVNKEDHGKIIYSMEKNDSGLEINKETGEVKINDYRKLYETLDKTSVKIQIKAIKEKYNDFPESSATYLIRINLNNAPYESYLCNRNTEENRWQNTPLTVKAGMSYSLCNKIETNITKDMFTDEIEFSEPGIRENSFFVRNNKTGEIYRKSALISRIDNTAPETDNMEVEIPELNIIEKAGVKLGFLKDFVKVRFKIRNEDFYNQSALYKIRWKFIGNKLIEDHIDEFQNDSEYTYGEIKVYENMKNIKGYFSFSAEDMAGNISETLIQNEPVIIADNINPEINIKQINDEASQNCNFIINIKEENFFEEDCKIYAERDKNIVPIKNVKWKHSKNQHEGKFSLSEEGIWQVYVEYEGDNSGNKTHNNGNYQSEEILIDRTLPIISAEYNGKNIIEENNYYNQDVKAEIMIEEKNLKEESVKVKIKNETGSTYTPEIEWTKENNRYTGNFIIKEEGTYIIFAECMDKKGNCSETYISEKVIIDKTRPAVEIKYDNKEKYLNRECESVITIDEDNLNTEDVIFNIECRNSRGDIVKPDYEKSQWVKEGNLNKIKIKYKEGNYKISVKVSDKAGNDCLPVKTRIFTIDTTPPENLGIRYSRSIRKDENSNIYYGGKAVITLCADDKWSKTDYFLCNYKNREIKITDIKYEGEGETATAELELPQGNLDFNNQFKGKIKFMAVDKCGNKSAVYNDNNNIIVDSISPELKVAYQLPVNSFENKNYYNKGIRINLEIKESNFYSKDVKISLLKNGVPVYHPLKWSAKNNINQTCINLNDDGKYNINIEYKDRSDNIMKSYDCPDFIIDKNIAEPELHVSDNCPVAVFKDTNIKEYKTRLLFKNIDGNRKDITNDMISHMESDGNTRIIKFKRIPDKKTYDGIYYLEGQMTDKSGNKSYNNISFTINRFGSTYYTDKYLESLIKNKGAFIQRVNRKFFIEEWNPSHIKDEKIKITRDGRNMENINVKKEYDSNSNEGWFNIKYVFYPDTFKRDGIYKIAISSEDDSGNMNDIVKSTGRNIVFTVDSTRPEIVSLTGLNKKIVNRKTHTIEYTAFDNFGISEINVFVNNKKTDVLKNFSHNENYYNGKIVIKEKFKKQNIEIVICDNAGNIYTYKDKLTVSTNLLARIINNIPLMIVIISVIFFITGTVICKKSKK